MPGAKPRAVQIHGANDQVNGVTKTTVGGKEALDVNFAGSSTAPGTVIGTVDTLEEAITAKNVIASASGDTIVHTPTAGKKIRLWWYNMAALPSNAGHVIAALKFAAGGTPFNRTPLSQYGAATAHSFKAGRSYVEGAVGEALIVNLDSANTVYVNIDFEEI